MFAVHDVGEHGKRNVLVGLYRRRPAAMAHRLRLARERRACSVTEYPLVEPVVRRLTGEREADALRLLRMLGSASIATDWPYPSTEGGAS